MKKAAEFEKQKQFYEKKALEVLESGKNALLNSTLPIEPLPKEDQAEQMVETSDKIALNKPVDDSKRKTVAKRNKEKRNKLRQRQEEDAKAEKKKINDINRIKEIVKEVQTEAKESDEKRKAKEEKLKAQLEERKEGVVFGNTKIGKYKYEQQAVDFQLPEELSRRLTGIKVEQENSIRNCYESIIKRGLIQPGTSDRPIHKLKTKLRYKFNEMNYNDPI